MAPERLEDLPIGRRCRKCGRTVFVEGGHCPKPCGAMLPANVEAVTTGHRSRQALKAARAAILEAWRVKYRDADGHISAAVDSVLRQLSRLEAISDRAIKWSEKTQEPLTSVRHSNVHDRVLACADRIARLQLVLAQLAPEASVADGVGRRVVFGGRWRSSGELTPGSTVDAPAPDVTVGPLARPAVPVGPPVVVDADVIPARALAPVVPEAAVEASVLGTRWVDAPAPPEIAAVATSAADTAERWRVEAAGGGGGLI